MSNSTRRELAGRWNAQDNARYVLQWATPQERDAFSRFAVAAIRALAGYDPKTAESLRQSFWVDARQDGLGAAMKAWDWLIKSRGLTV